MKKSLYRGKRIDNNEWVTGNLFIADDGKCQILIGYINYRIAYDVIPETISQYTGINEQDGDKIFEGDCLGDWGENEEGQECICIMGVVTFVKDWGRYLLMDMKGYATDWTYEKEALPENWGNLMIAGNIYDNPELLKEINNEE